MTTAAHTVSQFLSALDFRARNSEKRYAVDFFQGHALVAASITADGKTTWKHGTHGRRVSYQMMRDNPIEVAQAALDHAARGQHIQMDAKVDHIDGHAPHVTLEGRVDLQIEGTYFRHGVGAVPRGAEGRKVQDGPMVAGPWAYAYGLSSCLSSSAAMREQDAARRATDVVVTDGTRLLIDGVSYTVKIVRREYIELVPDAV